MTPSNPTPSNGHQDGPSKNDATATAIEVPADSTAPLRAARAKERRRLLVGSGFLVLLFAGTMFVTTRPAFTSTVSRVSSVLGSGLDAERDSDFVTSLPFSKGVHAGLPVYGVGNQDGARPLGHVVSVSPLMVVQNATEDANDESKTTVEVDGVRVRIRFEPGEAQGGPWRLEGFRPSRKIGEAFRLAVPDKDAKEFAAYVADRLRLTWDESILPEAERRLPAFLARINPSNDNESKELVEALGSTLLKKMEPLLSDLAGHVTKRLKKKFDVLDRLGMLWDLISGDSKELKKEILPVARDASVEWWKENQKRVFGELGDGFGKHSGALKNWVAGELWSSFREEMLEPILKHQGERLEAEGSAMIRRATKTFVEAPGGGFRIRFNSMLRHNLLNKKTALLLLHRVKGTDNDGPQPGNAPSSSTQPDLKKIDVEDIPDAPIDAKSEALPK